MARQMSATQHGGMSTFLLEMALDKRRMKARLAALLIEERTQRGHGDARRFPQPEMASLLGYSLRQYQRLEDPDDGSLPIYSDLTEILEKLDRSPTDIFGEEGDLLVPVDELATPTQVDGDRLAQLERQVEDVRQLVGEVLQELRARHSSDESAGR